MKISACVIAKNEEENLPRLLRSLRGKFDEIVLVDTGSTDRTVEIARSFGCKVVITRWEGFAEARNRALAGVSKESSFVWHFDADFELEEEEFRKALYYLKNLPSEVDGLFVGVRNLSKEGGVKGISSHIFIHRNLERIRWEGKVHEYPTVNLAVGIPVFVNHYGYADGEVQFKKALRNLELLEGELRESSYSKEKYLKRLFFLLQTLTVLSYKEPSFLKRAYEVAREFISKSNGLEEELGFFFSFALNYFVSILKLMGKDRELLKLFKTYENSPFLTEDFLFQKLIFLIERRDYEEAFNLLLRLASTFSKAEENPFFSSSVFVSDHLLDFQKLLASLSKKQEFWESLKEEEKRRAKELFRRERGKYLGFVVALSFKDCKLLRKLSLRYGEPLFLGALREVCQIK
ncbi:glycosyltransferase [Thermovibrio sp.]